MANKATGSRNGSRPLNLWLGVLVSMVCVSLMVAYFFYIKPCGYAETGNCQSQIPGRPHLPNTRLYSDEEIASHAVAKDILSRHPKVRPAGSKIAFMFMTPGPLPFAAIWENFFKGHEGLYSLYVHASESNITGLGWLSPVFIGREIPSRKVSLGSLERVDAKKRLLSQALLDPANVYFVLLSESCIPLFDFDYIFTYLMNAEMSFIDSFDDPGLKGRGSYADHMKPEVQAEDWRKGVEWIAVHREHAIVIVLDHMYYNKFKAFCRPGVDEENFKCLANDHYMATTFNIINPTGIANRSLTFEDWSKGEKHPRSFGKGDMSASLLREIQVSSSDWSSLAMIKDETSSMNCTWNDLCSSCCPKLVPSKGQLDPFFIEFGIYGFSSYLVEPCFHDVFLWQIFCTSTCSFHEFVRKLTNLGVKDNKRRRGVRILSDSRNHTSWGF